MTSIFTKESFEEARILLSTATSVEHYNEIRDYIKESTVSYDRVNLMYQIDSSGLIVKNLGMDYSGIEYFQLRPYLKH